MTNPVPPTEFSERFVQAMRSRMAVSYFKYGPVAQAYPHRVDAIQCLHRALERYTETGNTEWLVDAGNYAMIEFMHPAHPAAHFRGTASSESPGRVSAATGRPTTARNHDLLIREFP